MTILPNGPWQSNLEKSPPLNILSANSSYKFMITNKSKSGRQAEGKPFYPFAVMVS